MKRDFNYMIRPIKIREKVSESECIRVDNISPETIGLIWEWSKTNPNIYNRIINLELIKTTTYQVMDDNSVKETINHSLYLEAHSNGDYSDKIKRLIDINNPYYIKYNYNGYLLMTREEFEEEYEEIGTLET